MSYMVDVDGLRMHVHTSGERGPAVVLLHGWPQDHRCWLPVIPDLARDHRVIAPDLRGYGLTDRPRGDYTKRTMAADIARLLDILDIGEVDVVGHDRGARVGHRFALDHSDRLHTLTVLDVAPTHAMMTSGTPTTTEAYFHWLLHMQTDLPDLLTNGRVEPYLRYFFDRWSFRKDRMEPLIPGYVAAFERPGAMRAGFDDYRATHADVADDEVDLRAGRRVTAPLLALWGGRGLADTASVPEAWRGYADDVTGRALDDCGHFIPEEAPAELLAELRRFWGRPAA